MSNSTCPNRETLALFLQGTLPDLAIAPLEEHLLQCDHCSQLAETIENCDAIANAMKRPPQIDLAAPKLAHIIERAKKLPGRSDTIVDGDTSIVEAEVSTEEYINFLRPAEQHDELGRLGDYRILDVVGVGGMGIVFRAQDINLKREVALKAMKPLIAADNSARNRFLREAQSAASIVHDHVVAIHQVGEDQGIPFIAMRLLLGETLNTRIKREKRLDQHEVVRIGSEIASGLAAAHEQGLVHRDIKPDNIWLEESTGRVKILDFGLTRGLAENADITQSGVVVGTPRYMAPEQAAGEPVDQRCDLFSLGSVLYRIASGKAPFQGSRITALLLSVSQCEPTPIHEIHPDLNHDLAQLIMRLLSRDPKDRPDSAADVAVALQATVQHDSATDATLDSNSGIDRRRWTALVMGGLIVAVAFAIVIRITDKNGVVTEVKVPDSTQSVEIDLSENAGTPINVSGAADREPVGPNGDKSTDRAKARVVLDFGGRCTVADDAGNVVQCGSIAELPNGSLKLLKISLSGVAAFHDEALLSLGTMDHLRALNLRGTRVTSAGLANLALCSDLNSVRLSATPVTDAGVRYLTELNQLRFVSLSDTPTSNAAVRSLTRISSLEMIDLNQISLTIEGLQALKNLPKLTGLEIGGPKIDNLAVAVVCELPHLNYLTIYAPSSVDDDCVESLSKLTQLTRLGLSGQPITDGAAKDLGKLNALLVLWVAGTRLTDASVPELCKLQHLNALDISGTQITATGLNALKAALPDCDIKSTVAQD